MNRKRESAPMIFRTTKNRENPYAQINRQLINDERLTWEARGMLTYLLDKPDNWQTWFNDLVKRSPAGSDKVRRIIKELLTFGYMLRIQNHDERGHFVWETRVFETPELCLAYMAEHDIPEPYAGFPYMVQPGMDNPDMDNPRLENRHLYRNGSSPSTDSNETKESDRALGIAGTFEDGKLYTALSDMSDSATGDMRTDDIPRNSPIPCADPEYTVKVDLFDSPPPARPGIVNGRPVRGAAPAVPTATKHASFAPTVAAIVAGYPARDGAGPTGKEVRRALALVDPAHYGAIVAALPVYSRCKDVREGVITGIGKWLEDERWTVYQPKTAPAAASQLPASQTVIEQRRAAIRARKERV